MECLFTKGIVIGGRDMILWDRNGISGLSGSAVFLCMMLTACVSAPEPLTEAEQQNHARNVADGIIRPEQEPIGPEIDIYEAMARAIKYNLDQWVEAKEAALRSEEVETATWALLPQLVANGGYAGRNNFSGARSSALIGPREIGAQSLVPSTSSEREVATGDLTTTWNILDFGLSYIRAKQANDNVLIALERRRRIVNQLIQEVRSVYWRAASAQTLLDRITELKTLTETALDESRALVERNATQPLAALTYQREILSIRREVQQLQRQVQISKAQLSALMNVKPGTQYRIVTPERRPPEFSAARDLEALGEIAFANRPEMRELIYQKRINEKEKKAILLEALPSLELYGGLNYDANDFLFNSNWVTWGSRTSWDLIQAIRLPQRRQQINAQNDLLNFQSYALGMAILTQLHVSIWRFELLKDELEVAQEYANVQSRILERIRAAADRQTISKQTLIREEMNDLLGQLRYDIAYADIENAFATIYTTLGLDPFPGDITGAENIGTLSLALEQLWNARSAPTRSVETTQSTVERSIKAVSTKNEGKQTDG